KVGLGRSYVKLDGGPLDFDAWTEGIKLGRTYVSDGKSHLIDFRVDDVEVGTRGSEKRLGAPGTVTIAGKVAARLGPEPSVLTEAIRNRPIEQKPYWDLERSRIGRTRTVPLEVVVNGKAVARREVEADGELRDVTFDVPIERSSWVALRVYPS